MIQVETIIHFYFDLEELNNHETVIIDYLHGLKGRLKTEEIISIGGPFHSRSGLASRVSVKMKVLMDERRSCKHLDDYASFVFPTIKSLIAGELISTQNLYMTYVRGHAPRQQKRINWEELHQHWND